MKKIIYIAFLLVTSVLLAQQKNLKEFTFNEYLGYVKKYHPLVKQANLKLNEAQAILMQARGAFDPKLEAEYTEKQYKDQNYFTIFNGSFKIPTWYGIEVKAAFDNNEGIYVNPDMTSPNSGLTSLGITVPIGQGLFINQRMADIRNAKLQQQLNKAPFCARQNAQPQARPKRPETPPSQCQTAQVTPPPSPSTSRILSCPKTARSPDKSRCRTYRQTAPRTSAARPYSCETPQKRQRGSICAKERPAGFRAQAFRAAQTSHRSGSAPKSPPRRKTAPLAQRRPKARQSPDQSQSPSQNRRPKGQNTWPALRGR